MRDGERATLGVALTHFSLAGGLDLEGLPQGLGGGTQWVVSPRTLGFALKRLTHHLPHKSQASFWMLPSKATQRFTTPFPSVSVSISFEPSEETRAPAGPPSVSPNLCGGHPHPVSQSSSCHP